MIRQHPQARIITQPILELIIRVNIQHFFEIRFVDGGGLYDRVSSDVDVVHDVATVRITSGGVPTQLGLGIRIVGGRKRVRKQRGVVEGL